MVSDDRNEIELQQDKQNELLEKESQTKWYTIDRKMISSKTFYFFLGAKVSCYEPYFILFLLSIGLNPLDAGMIGGLRFVGQIIGGTFWGFIADYKKCYRLVMIIVTIGSIVAMIIQPFISLWIGEQENNMCPKVLTSNTTFVHRSSTNTSNNETKDGKKTEQKLFLVLLVINIVAKFFEGPQIGFIDSAVIEKCRIHPKDPDHGHQCVLNPVGFGVAIIFSNIMVDYFPKVLITCYTGVFVNYLIIHLGYLMNAMIIFRGLTFETKIKNQDSNKKIWKVLQNHIDFDLIFFLVTVLVTGMQSTMFLNFTLILLKELKAPTIANGVAMAVGGFSAFIPFRFGTIMKNKLGGDWATLMACNFVYASRYLIMSFLRNPWIIAAIQVMDIFGFPLFLIAAISYIKRKLPPEIRTFIYSLQNTSFVGASAVFVNIIGGEVIQVYDAKFLFLLASIVAFVWFAVIGIYIIANRVMKRSERLIVM